ncbi:GntR family transcriptional regulator [Salinicola halophilus]|uniref:GntR family transcriptional regulator n=1 Tax=Salinicola halophilus TaxID=184065 RepID=UPI00195507F5|nr:GntR family transcriptional regulator [Salinicola halophilus]
MPNRDASQTVIDRETTGTDDAPNADGITVPAIVSAIEEEIVLSRLHPRERLVEEDLMRRFDGKRHIVRQALFQLENAGLVERIKNRGAFVRAYTPDEVEAIYAMRELLEGSAAAQIPLPAPSSLLEALNRIQHAHSEAIERSDWRAVFRHNIDFHRTLFAACGNPYLSETINDFAQKAHAIRFIGTTDRESIELARDEHRGMIDALEREDREAFSRLCHRHLQPSKERYLRLYRQREGG